MSIGVLAMSYGTPRDRGDIDKYYTDIRRGHPPTPDALAELVHRYDAIGGTFPLREITQRQVDALSRHLGEEYVVAIGTKHSSPSIEDGVRRLAEHPVDRVLGLVLAPHYSRMSVGAYADRAAKAGAEYGLAVETVESWHLLPGYLAFLAGAVKDALSTLPPGSEVVFTAHSLPARTVTDSDPYPAQLQETASAVAAAAGLEAWSVGWQSAGRTAEEWLGPDVLDIVRARASSGSPGLVVCACGFVADHLEVAYDLDIEAANLAGELELPFARTRSVNDDDTVMRGLAELVRSRSS